MLLKSDFMLEGHLGQTKQAQNRIKFSPEDMRPVQYAKYQAGPKGRGLENNEIAQMLELEVIEPVQTERTWPIIFSPKKDGLLWFCVDYRMLNAVSVHDSYTILRMDDCIV